MAQNQDVHPTVFQSPSPSTDMEHTSAPSAPPRPSGGAININGSPIQQPSAFNPSGSPSMQGRRNGNGAAHRVLPFDPDASAHERTHETVVSVHSFHSADEPPVKRRWVPYTAPTSAVGAHETVVLVHPTEPNTLVIQRVIQRKRQRRNAIDERPADDNPVAEPPAKKRCMTAEPAEAAVVDADDLPPTFAFDADADASAYFGALILYLFILFDESIAVNPKSIPMMRAYQCFIKLFEACNEDVSLFARIVTGPYLCKLTTKMRQMVPIFKANKQQHHHYALAGYIDDVVLFMRRNPDTSHACPDTVKQMLQVLNSATSKRKVHNLAILPKPAGLAIMRKYAYYYPPRKLDGSYFLNDEIANIGWDMLVFHLRNRFGGRFFF